jgi:Repeat of Unknown Function (DUF347)
MPFPLLAAPVTTVASARPVSHCALLSCYRQPMLPRQLSLTTDRCLLPLTTAQRAGADVDIALWKRQLNAAFAEGLIDRKVKIAAKPPRPEAHLRAPDHQFQVESTLLFWSAFILTRPVGATVGDLLTKPIASGGLNLSRISSSLVITIFMIGCILFMSQRAGGHSQGREQNP